MIQLYWMISVSMDKSNHESIKITYSCMRNKSNLFLIHYINKSNYILINLYMFEYNEFNIIFKLSLFVHKRYCYIYY